MKGIVNRSFLLLLSEKHAYLMTLMSTMDDIIIRKDSNFDSFSQRVDTLVNQRQ